MSDTTDKLSVLIVDDEEGIVEMLSELLQDEYEVHSAGDGLAALAILQERPVDIILCDQQMPRMKGTDLLQASLDIAPQSERIVFTAYADLDTVISCVNDARVSTILTKPIDPQHLKHTMRKAADVQRLRYENNCLLASLQRHNSELAEQVAAQTADLRAANSELKALQKSREEMFRMAVHDMKNPLSNLTMALNGIRKNAANGMEDYLEIAGDSVNALNALVVDMLSVASLSSSTPQIKLRPMQLGSILADSVTSFRAAARQKAIALTADLAENLPPVEVNEHRLREAIDNLVSNALKYTARGGQVLVSLRDSGDKALVRVCDNGQGMTSEDIDNAFGEFRKLSARPTEGESSTGLGLFIVKRIIALHKGEIRIESRGKNCGTCFIIELPYAPRGAAKKSD